jgi:CheY-like chemotaxis protein
LTKSGSLKVLVVEDDKLLRLSVLDMLEDLGHVGIEAADASSALKILGSMRRLQVMLIDVGLPGMDGSRLAKIARDLRSDLRIVFATGRGREILAKTGLNPVVRYLPKPYRLQDLENTLNSLEIPARVAASGQLMSS